MAHDSIAKQAQAALAGGATPPPGHRGPPPAQYGRPAPAYPPQGPPAPAYQPQVIGSAAVPCCLVSCESIQAHDTSREWR